MSTVIFLTTTGANTWTVPGDWNNSGNTIEVIGAGGGGMRGASSSQWGAGGGGGAYSKISNLSLTPAASVNYTVGVAGAGGTSGADGQDGGDTFFNAASLGASSVGAKGGKGATSNSVGGAGGASASGIGTTKNSGGAGASSNGGTTGGNGGGGAAGPNGVGGAGGHAVSGANSGGGGGGNGGGSAGADATVDLGGAGGNNSASAGGGARGSSPNGSGADGTVGGGGGGGTVLAGNGGNGGPGNEWDSTHGSGGGGGGPAYTNGTAGSGGLYGGGGAGSANTPNGGAGAQGIIVITYTPAGATVTSDFYSPAEFREAVQSDLRALDETTALQQRDGYVFSETLAALQRDSLNPGETRSTQRSDPSSPAETTAQQMADPHPGAETLQNAFSADSSLSSEFLASQRGGGGLGEFLATARFDGTVSDETIARQKTDAAASSTVTAGLNRDITGPDETLAQLVEDPHPGAEVLQVARSADISALAEVAAGLQQGPGFQNEILTSANVVTADGTIPLEVKATQQLPQHLQGETTASVQPDSRAVAETGTTAASNPGLPAETAAGQSASTAGQSETLGATQQIANTLTPAETLASTAGRAEAGSSLQAAQQSRQQAPAEVTGGSITAVIHALADTVTSAFVSIRHIWSDLRAAVVGGARRAYYEWTSTTVEGPVYRQYAAPDIDTLFVVPAQTQAWAAPNLTRLLSVVEGTMLLIEKHPQSTQDFTFDLSDLATDNNGGPDPVVSVTITAESGITAVNQAAALPLVTIRIGGGVETVTYRVTVKATLTSGQVKAFNVNVYVVGLTVSLVKSVLPVKDPQSNEAFKIDWAAQLAVGATVTAADWELPVGLTQSNPVNTDTTASTWIAGGASIQTALITQIVDVSTGEILAVDLPLNISQV